jgi:hypothetical protein
MREQVEQATHTHRAMWTHLDMAPNSPLEQPDGSRAFHSQAATATFVESSAS